MKALITLLLISWGCTVKAQEDVLIQEIIEGFADQLPEDYDLYELTERLSFYQKHPIDLNKTSPEDLKKLVFVSPLQIASLFEHLKTNGQLIDVLELQGISGFDLQTINRILPFIKISAPSDLSQLRAETFASNDLIIRYGRTLQTQKGFHDLPGSRYLGSPDKLLLRYKYLVKDFMSVSLVAEKDAGEHFIHGKSGADHLSGNVTFQKFGPFKKLVVGDYSMQFGQGLALWSGFAFGKGPDVTSVASKDLGLRPYSSSNESSFLRGIASTIGITKYIDFTSFFSSRKLDASLKSSADGSMTLENINISGLHRTPTELKNQKSLGQVVYGAAFQYAHDHLNMGLVTYKTQYQQRFVTGNQLYNKYSFEGEELLNTGVNYSYTFKNMYFYGELAHSIGSGWALLNGIMASLSPRISAVLLYRNYEKNYHSFFSRAIGEGTETNNERGIYGGMNYTPHKYWSFSLYADYFKFPWLKYRIDAASEGYELLGQMAFTPNKTTKILLRYKREIKSQNADAGSLDKGIQSVLKQNFRVEGKWSGNKQLNFQSRAEVACYQKGIAVSETGYLVYQDVNYKPLNTKLSGNLRLAYFNTPSYNSRIYAYEDDVLYGSAFGIYHGKGFRSFINLRYQVMKSLDVWFRYATSFYKDVETVGSGLDEIRGNKKTDVKLQVRYQF
ncbi:ComEA family DNA-binding protein [Pedobacter frigoris]|uniref:Helix-hairpin-helix domain-containing protein n=1 Tax=Pedobacter frigoris TaxID=2571272 RepID=A0A4U1CLE0_9SPHI|nr:helix-hairpin-helix domain-containing protein [Pedobacter frigoris]TKC05990.1 helix-hairpin-helix domain-containing protein [Pedobacter frigoris]